MQQYYENNDSIILLPFNTTGVRSMKMIGKDVQINTIVNKPNTLFFSSLAAYEAENNGKKSGKRAKLEH